MLSYDDATGEAELELFPQNAGKTPVIYLSDTSDLENNGKELSTTRISTSATKLWFVSKDPNDQHETRQPEAHIQTALILILKAPFARDRPKGKAKSMKFRHLACYAPGPAENRF